jgi:hypothetical protein
MKAIVFLSFSLFFIFGTLTGQTEKFKDPDGLTYKHIEPFPKPDLPQLGKPDFNMHRNYELPPLIAPDGISKFHNYYSLNHDSIVVQSESPLYDEFPGASVYYAKKPDFNSGQYDNYFIIKPETTVKYYLIVKDPTPARAIK